MSACGPNAQPPRFELVVVVASLGGLPPLSALLAGLPADFPVPVLVLRHYPVTEREDKLAWLLARRTALPVRSACQGVVAPGPGVTVISHGHTAEVGIGRYLHLRPKADRIGLGRTEADALLVSAASASPPGTVIGVVLSGMMHDGTEGIRAVKRHGGRVLAQDPDTALARHMPASAIATGCVDFIVAPERMQPRLSPWPWPPAARNCSPFPSRTGPS